MSQTGKLTPLSVNALSELSVYRGFAINSTAKQYQGSWTPGIDPSGYVQGSLTASTCLKDLVSTIPMAYKLAREGYVSIGTYRRLLLIGQNVCPALGDSRPSTFKQTYAGYGNWDGARKLSGGYPTKGYPSNPQYSYVNQAYGNYAWITGWPGKNSWQKTDDEYMAAYLPTNESQLTDYDEYFKDGFVGTIARQAYYELAQGEFTQYNNIVTSFQQTSGWRNQRNQEVASLENSKTFLSGNFSNIDDVTTNNLSGVNQAFRIWGNDFIALGRAIDLSQIYKFGSPQALLLNLQKNRCNLDSVKMAMMLVGMTTDEMTRVFDPEYVATSSEEKKLYDSFKLVQGEDLYGIESGVLLGINCKTKGLSSLADLLDPKKMFPNSYPSFTVPQYRVDTVSSKTYYFIYDGNGTNMQIASLPGVSEIYDTLSGILPSDIAAAAAAFSVTIQQANNVMQADVEKLSLSIADLELVSKGLPLLNTANGVTVNVGAVDNLLKDLRLGSGNGGTFKQSDFFGAASGTPYVPWYEESRKILNQLPTGPLASIYSQMLQVVYTPLPEPPVPPDPPTPPIDYDGLLSALITQANQIISQIYNSNRGTCDKLNYYWNEMGNQLFIEQRAWPLSVEIPPSAVNGNNNTSLDDFKPFIQAVEEYALDNGPGENADILERISDLSTLGGQSLVGMMREARNGKRLNWMGAGPENDIPDELDLCSASAAAIIDSSGSIIEVEMINRSQGYNRADPPEVRIYPYGFGGILEPIIAEDGSIESIRVINSGKGYPLGSAQIEITPPPGCLPPMNRMADYFGTSGDNILEDGQVVENIFDPENKNPEFNRNPYLPGPVPPLPPPNTSSPSVQEAIENVTICNCDCWNL